MRALILLTVTFGISFAATGFDASASLTTEQFKCMKSHGYSFFIGRVHQSTGAVDSHGIQNLKNAKAAGITNVDGYIFPCTTSSCASPASQVQSTVNALKSAGASVGMLWLDIEIYHWPADHTKNREFIEAMGKELTASGHNWGVYSSYNNWQSIVGLDYTGLSHKQLWWATYNNEANFNNFKAFGGWTKPNIHQYQGDAKGPCGFSIDNNYYP
ncbi:unnamed protein product [Cylicocyclus nassatus]|uniref:Lysozyme n=1 Tax=Cylicocyclus nassatus TaxID=53992 RepID=A0AA36HGX7_CYLNA|nr:unnamed protein product [Cylicocyclus nassatus]